MTEVENPGVSSPDEDVPPGGTNRRARTGPLLVAVCAVQFMDAMDIASMGPALPVIQHELGMSADALQWVVSAYTLGFGGFLLLGGRLADLFDRKKLLLGFLLVFVLASFVGGLTHDGTVLVAARLLKGISAGFTAPIALAVLLDAFREPRERNRAMGVFLAVASTGYSLGLVLGGVLAEIGWRLVLFLPAAVGLLVTVLAAGVVPAHRRAGGAREPVDVLGAITVTTSAVALVYGVSHASSSGWGDPVTLGSIGAGVLLLVVFVLVERRHEAPLVPLRIFGRRQLALANVCMLFFGVYVSFQFVLTLYYQNELHWSPLQAGLGFLLGGVLTAATARYGAILVTRYGPWRVAAAGLAMLSAGYLVWALLIGHVPALGILLVQQLLGGFGFAAAYPALSIAAVGSAAEREQGLASGLFNTSSQVGAGLAVAITATALTIGSDSGLGGYRAGLWVTIAMNLAVTAAAAFGGLRRRGSGTTTRT